MKTIWIGLLVAVATAAHAQLKQVGPGGYVADFAGGTAAVVGDGPGKLKKEEGKPGSLKALEVIQHNGKYPALRLEGTFQNRVFFDIPPLKDFVLVTTLTSKGNFGGVVVRDDYTVFLNKKGYLCLGDRRKSGMLFKSDKILKGLVTLKVVCAGPVLRVLANDEEVITFEVDDKPGRVGVYAHEAEVIYREFRVSEKVDWTHLISVMPVTPQDDLVMTPGTDRSLEFKIANRTGKPQSLEMKMMVTDWQEKPVVAEQTKSVNVDKEAVVTFALRGLPQGFYRLVASATCGKETVYSADDLPLAVQERGRAEFRKPDLVVAAYSKYSNRTEPVVMHTYIHATARILREMGFNAIVFDPTFNQKVVDIYGSYGIATITRTGKFIDSPFVIATLESDEPKIDEIPRLKERYAESKKAGKQVTSCMIGESMGLGGPRDPLTLWRMLEADLRAFRWYGLKKGYYGLIHGSTYKGWPSLSTVLRVADGAKPSEWWFIPPSFGDTRPDAYYKNPTPAELKGMMHMAIAHGAKGLMLWTLHDVQRWPALIGKKSLAPTDGKFAAATEAGTLISRNAALLKSLSYGGFAIRNSDWVRMEAVPRKSPDGQTYIYVVNKDKDAPTTARIAFPASAAHTVKDLYAGKEYATTPAGDGFQAVDITLTPGSGALLAVQATVPTQSPPAPAVEPLGNDSLAKVAAKADAEGATLLTMKMPAVPCAPGDAIGFWRNDDPRLAWQQSKTGPNLFSWSGGLAPRTEAGFIEFESALLYASTASKNAGVREEGEATDAKTKAESVGPKRALWTLLPAMKDGQMSPEELRAMLHFSLAYGAQAVLVSDNAGAMLGKVVEEVAAVTKPARKWLPALDLGGSDPACSDPHVALVPLTDGASKNYIYAINRNLQEPVAAEVVLLAQNWTWTAAKDVCTGRPIPVAQSKQQGYTGCAINLLPGEGKLIEITVQRIEKQRKTGKQAQQRKNQ